MTNEALVIEYQNGNHAALDDLVRRNKRLVYHFANKYGSLCPMSFIDKDDLIQEGFIGLMYAAQNFDIAEDENEAEYNFSSYASKAIVRRILRLANQHIPRESKSDFSSEIITINSIHDFVHPGSETTWEEVLPFEKNVFRDVEREIDNELLKDDLIKLLDEVFGEEFTVDLIRLESVENREALFERIEQGITGKEVILLHYGLLGKKMTFAQLSERVNLSPQRLHQIESKAIWTIRKSEQVIPFIEKYGDDFRLNGEAWIQSYHADDSFQTITEKMNSIDELIERLII